VGLWNFDDPADPGHDSSPGAHPGKLIGQATVTNVELPVIVFGKITDAAGGMVGGATVEVHQPGREDQRVTSNEAGEYAFTVSPSAHCDLFVTTGTLSAYRLGFQPSGEGRQQLDWTLAQTQGTASATQSSNTIPSHRVDGDRCQSCSVARRQREFPRTATRVFQQSN
jgi:hypothetical protein